MSALNCLNRLGKISRSNFFVFCGLVPPPNHMVIVIEMFLRSQSGVCNVCSVLSEVVTC